MTQTPIPDLSPAKFEINTVLEWEDWKHELLPRIEFSSKRDIRHLTPIPAHNIRAIIIGAGPSAQEFLHILKSDNPVIFSLNGAHQWLLDKHIVPNIHVLSEHDVEAVNTALGGRPHVDCTYYLASHCHSEVFSNLEGNRRVLWHFFLPLEEYEAAIAKHFPGEPMIAGGYATFFKTLTIALILGFRDFDLFGVDGSFDKNSHLDGYPTSNVEESINVWGTDPRTDAVRKFKSHGGLAFQANEFIKFCTQYHTDIKLRIHGDSLMRYLHESRYPEQYNTKG